MTRRTTTIAIVRIVEEDDFSTPNDTDVIQTTAEELPSHTRIPLPPGMRALAKRLARWEGEGR